MPSELRGRRSDVRESSRVASPRDGLERPSGPMDKFIEPGVASQTSFAEQQAHNHTQPMSVLENMQPLGEIPSARTKAKLKLDGSRRSTALRGGVTGSEVQTPEGTPQPATRSQAKADSVGRAAVPTRVEDDGKDGEYDPDAATAATANGRKSGRPQRTRKKKEPSPVEREDTPPEMQRTTLPIGGTWTDSEIRSIVSQAKQQAHEKGEPESAVHVEEIYQMSCKNERLHHVLVRVLSQVQTPGEMKEFEHFTRLARRRVKRAAKRAAELQAAADTSHSTPPPKNTLTRKEPSIASVNTAPKTQAKQISQTATAAAASSSKSSTSSASSNKAIERSRNGNSQKVVSSYTPRIKLGSPIIEPREESTSKRSSRTHSREVIDEKIEDLGPQLNNDLDLQVNGRASVKLSPATSPPASADSPFDTVMSDAVPASKQASAAPETQPRERAAARKSREASRATLAVPHTNNKRSASEADLQRETEQDRELHAKKQKLSGDVVREYDFEDSFERNIIRSPPPSSKARTSSRINGTPVSSKKRRSNLLVSDDEESDLTTPEMTPPPPPPPPTGKRAKTKHS